MNGMFNHADAKRGMGFPTFHFVAYDIINGTASALAVGGVTTAAYTTEVGTTLTDANLATLCSQSGVACMKTTSSASERKQIGNRILAVTADGTIPSFSVVGINGSAASMDNYNVALDDLAAYTVGAMVLSPSELLTFIALNSAAVMQTAASAAEKLEIGNRLVAQSAQGSIPAVAVVGINGSAASMDNYNAAADDLAAYTIAAASMSPSELITFIALDSAGVMQTAASAAEKLQVGNLLVDGTGAAPGNSYIVANGSLAEITDINAAADDVALGEDGTVTLTPSELLAALVTDGVAVLNATSDSEERRRGAKVLQLGALPGQSVTAR